MNVDEVSPEIIALREKWKDASNAGVLAAWDAGEMMDADTVQRAHRLARVREAAAEGVSRYPSGSRHKKKPDSDIVFLEITNIHISDSRRPLVEDRVVELMESIRKVGLLHPPIIVSKNGMVVDGEEDDRVPVLVAGRHRVEAWRRLGHTVISCLEIENVSDIEAELMEIGENLHRAELTALQRADQIARWIALTGSKDEVESEGGSAILRQPDAKPGRPEGGVRAAARELGLSEPDARRAVKVASLSPQAKAAAVDAGLDNNRSVLLEAARETEPEKQVEVLHARADRPAAVSVAEQRVRDDEMSRELAALLVKHLPPDALARVRELLNLDVVGVRYVSGIPVVPIIRDLDALTASSSDFAPPVRTPTGREWEQDEAA